MKFSLKRVFGTIAVLGLLFALIGFIVRPKPGHVPEAVLLRSVEGVAPGDSLDEIVEKIGFEPSAKWLDQKKCGYVLWRFHVTDVPHASSRASYFALLQNGNLKEATLLYPLESAGGGMAF